MYGQMGWNPQMYSGYMGTQPMQDQLAQLRAQQQYTAQMPFQQTQPQMAAQQPAQGSVIWVQGEAGAKSFLVAPGQSVMLMDSESEVFYIKSSDQAGIPLPLRTFDYKERMTSAQRPAQAAQNPSEFVTRAEYDAVLAKLADITAKLNAMTAQEDSATDQPREHMRRRQMKEEEMNA